MKTCKKCLWFREGNICEFWRKGDIVHIIEDVNKICDYFAYPSKCKYCKFSRKENELLICGHNNKVIINDCILEYGCKYFEAIK